MNSDSSNKLDHLPTELRHVLRPHLGHWRKASDKETLSHHYANENTLLNSLPTKGIFRLQKRQSPVETGLST